MVSANDTLVAGIKLMQALNEMGPEASEALVLAKNTYRIWITPTVEYPASRLNNLKPTALNP